MKLLVRRIRHRIADEAGAALVVVIALSITMLILITAALSFSLSGVKTAQNDSDATAALEAAFAGVDEYSSRLSNDTRYQRFGNPDAPFTISTGSAATVALPPPGQENPAFGLGPAPAGTWGTIKGAIGDASFRYEVDNSRYASSGILRVRSTGRVGNATQSIVADLKQSGFIDYLYFTDSEIQDPTISNSFSATPCLPADYKAKVSGSGFDHSGGCREIQFGANDVLDGKAHSNDVMLICGGAEFKQKVTTGNSIANGKYSKCDNGVVKFSASNPGGVIPFDGSIQMPKTNGSMQNEGRLDLPEITRPGCIYTGPTQIKFLASGKITVISPWTKHPRVWKDDASKSLDPSQECGNVRKINSSVGDTFTPPEQNLIWVQTVPSDSADPNYWAPESTTPKVCIGWNWFGNCNKWSGGVTTPAETPIGFTCTNSGSNDERWVYSRAAKDAAPVGPKPTVQYPLANEITPTEAKKAGQKAYGCENGDAYIEGTLKGQLTVASDNYVYITGDILYSTYGAGGDVLGIVGNNEVWVWNPMKTGNNTAGCAYNGSNTFASTGYYCSLISKPAGRTINAAILSVQRTFQVQNYSLGGPQGTLRVKGAIAQTFRGTVGGTFNGYSQGWVKDYRYDDNLFETSPPKFLTPTSTTYGVTKFALVESAFNADGSVIP